MPPLRTDVSDGALIERTRRGDRAAYGELWQRHAASARTVARSYSSLDPDDLVAESFTKIYDAILAGGGPRGAFRPYLFTTLRNTAASWGRGRRETNLEMLESFEDPDTTESATLEGLDRSTTAQAFQSLPTRWQESGLPAGTAVLTAAQTDVAGNTSPPSAPVAVELIAPSLELRRTGPLWHLTFTGVPESTVQVLVDGTPRNTLTLDGSGTAKYLALGWGGTLDEVEVRYTVGDRTGPTAPATVVDPD